MTPEGRPEDLVAAWIAVCAALVLTGLLLRRARRLRGRPLLLFANAAVLGTLALAVLVGLETWLRHGYDKTTWHAMNNVSQAWFERHWHTNAEGFRDVEWGPLSVVRHDRVVVVGDSFTAGYGVAAPEHRFADRLRARLSEARGHPVDLRNVATIGADTPRELQILTTVVERWRPARVVLGYTLNDNEYQLDKSLRDGGADPGAARGSWIRRSYLLDLVRARWALANSDHAEKYAAALDHLHNDPVLLEEHARRLTSIADLCSTNGVRLDVVVFPLFSRWTGATDDYACNAWHDAIVAAWRRAGVRALDLRAAYAGIPGDDLVVGAFDSHPNERAHAIAADAIWAEFFADGD